MPITSPQTATYEKRMPLSTPSIESLRLARIARDPRFDGQFYIGVKTTGIYCRPICPAPQPKEENVEYFTTAIEASEQGYRPCLRCRPDAAPGSKAWAGTDTTLERALKLIDEGALTSGSIPDLADRLGITPRYLNKLFQRRFGISAKRYALYQQVLLAKRLLHETTLDMSSVAFAAGFNSVRRFNDQFSKQLKLTPTSIRRKSNPTNEDTIRLFLSYRPPYPWQRMQRFLQQRYIPDMEWIDEQSYGRTLTLDSDLKARFTATHIESNNGFDVTIELEKPAQLMGLVSKIRHILDLDADTTHIDKSLGEIEPLKNHLIPGLRVPGLPSLFEAGIRAILGQQITVTAARNLLIKLVQAYGAKDAKSNQRYFPTPKQLSNSSLDALRMPQSRKDTVRRFAEYMSSGANHPNDWLSIKGIGPWTVSYADMRGAGNTDIWLAGDAGVKNMLTKHGLTLNPEVASPWRSYLTLQVWNLT